MTFMIAVHPSIVLYYSHRSFGRPLSNEPDAAARVGLKEAKPVACGGRQDSVGGQDCKALEEC